MVGPPTFSLDALRRTALTLEGELWDRMHGVRTGGTIREPAVHQRFAASAAESSVFQAAWISSIRILITRNRRIAPHASSFIDIGCGRGRACLYAAAAGIFNEVVGIDLSADLVSQARENASRFRRRRSSTVLPRFEVADAMDFELPTTQAQVFMFNPFTATLMNRFLTRHRAHFLARRSTITVANDRFGQVLSSHGFYRHWHDRDRMLSVWGLTDDDRSVVGSHA